MNKQIQELAADARGQMVVLITVDDEQWRQHEEFVEKFAALVAAHEREACAVIAETPISGEQDDITMEAKDRVAKAIRARGTT
jgi:hypothetical protein